jgi:hypothetical protein
MLKELAHDGVVAAADSCVKDGGALAVNGVGIGAAIEQEAYRGEMSASDGDMEGGCPGAGSDASGPRGLIFMLADRLSGCVCWRGMAQELWFGAGVAVSTEAGSDDSYEASC